MEVSELSQKHNANEKAAYYLLSFDPPITSLASVACLGGPPELIDQLFKEAPLTHLPLVLSARAFYREAQAKYDASLVSFRTPSRARVTLHFDTHQPRRQKRVLDSDSEPDVDPDFRRGLLGEFPKRFGFRTPVSLQASDRIIKKLARHRKKKMNAFISSSDISAAADLKIHDQDVKMGKNKKLVAHDKRKKNKFNASSHSFLNALGTLLLYSGVRHTIRLLLGSDSHPLVDTSLFRWPILAIMSGFPRM